MIIVFDLDDTLYEEMTFVRGGMLAVANFLKEKIKDKSAIPYPIQKAEHIIKWSLSNKKSLAEISMENEMCWLSKEKIISSLDKIWETR